MVIQTFAILALTVSPQGNPRLPGQGLAGEQAKFFRLVIETPTGANGYEEFVEAAALLKSEEYVALQKFEHWLSWSDRFKHKDAQGRYVMDRFDAGKSNEQTVLAPAPPPGLTHHSTMLDLNRHFVERFGGVIPIVERGNRKLVFQPRKDIGLDTLLPELSMFREVGRMFARKAEVEFAAGSSAAGTQALLEGMRFGRNLSTGTLVNSLSGTANIGLMLYTFEKVVGRLSLADARAVLTTADGLIKLPPAATAAIKAELSVLEGAVDSVIAKPQLLDQTVRGGNRPELIDRINALDESKKQAVQSRAKELLRYKAKEIGNILDRSEPQWHRATYIELPVSRDERDWLESISGQIVNSLVPSYDNVFAAQARSRAQLRCLRATARVVIFKWQNGHLPSKIEEAVPESEIEDPASGGRLKYESSAPWHFKVESAGWGKVGPIGIRYRPKPSDDTVSPSGPRPPQ